MELIETDITEIINKDTVTEYSLLQEVKQQKEKLDEYSKNFKEAFERIYSDTDKVKFNISTENTLKIGVESVRPLIDMKTHAAEVFSNVRNNEINMLHKPINFEDYENHIFNLRKESSETRKIINMLGVLTEASAKLIDPQNQLTSGNCNESNVSSQSVASSDPSISEFSLFDHSTINAATSSPMSTPEKQTQL